MNVSDTGQEAEDQITSQPADHGQQDHQVTDQPSRADEPLYRPLEGRMVAGVAAGIAQYLGVDVNVVRIVLAVLTVIGGAGIPVYAAGWLLIPDEGASQSIASDLIGSLQGRPS